MEVSIESKILDLFFEHNQSPIELGFSKK